MTTPEELDKAHDAVDNTIKATPGRTRTPSRTIAAAVLDAVLPDHDRQLRVRVIGETLKVVASAMREYGDGPVSLANALRESLTAAALGAPVEPPCEHPNLACRLCGRWPADPPSTPRCQENGCMFECPNCGHRQSEPAAAPAAPVEQEAP